MASFFKITRRSFVVLSAGAWALVSSGCGLLLYPERRGQPSGRLDWGVVLLDGLGLLLFFIPGLIAFAVDFATGTIYLPPDEYGKKAGAADRRELVKIVVPRKELSKAKIEQVVSGHVGRPVKLSEGRFWTRSLKSIDDFWQAAEQAGEAEAVG
jgi:hypothetical protein